MLDGQITRYEQRIWDEERLAREASSSEHASAHQQVAMIFKSQLAIVCKQRAVALGETIAEIG